MNNRMIVGRRKYEPLTPFEHMVVFIRGALFVAVACAISIGVIRALKHFFPYRDGSELAMFVIMGITGSLLIYTIGLLVTVFVEMRREKSEQKTNTPTWKA